jgi:hypothetical protein
MTVVALHGVIVHAAMVTVIEALLVAVTTMIGEGMIALHPDLVGLWMIIPHLLALVATRTRTVVTILPLLII